METSPQASGEQDFLVSPIPHDPEGSWGQSLSQARGCRAFLCLDVLIL